MLLSVIFALAQTAAAPVAVPAPVAPAAPSVAARPAVAPVAAEQAEEETSDDPNANMDQFTLFVWTDRNGVRHYTDDVKRAPKGVSPRVVYSDRPATPVAVPQEDKQQ